MCHSAAKCTATGNTLPLPQKLRTNLRRTPPEQWRDTVTPFLLGSDWNMMLALRASPGFFLPRCSTPLFLRWFSNDWLMWSVTCCAGIASLPRCTKSPRAWRCSWRHHTAQKFYKSYAVGVLECRVVSTESVRTKGAGACQLSAEQNEPTVQLQLGGWHFQNRQTAKSARDCSLIMFNLRVYNTGTTSSKFIISSQHLHTGQTGPTCPQLGPNLDTQLGPNTGQYSWPNAKCWKHAFTAISHAFWFQ